MLPQTPPFSEDPLTQALMAHLGLCRDRRGGPAKDSHSQEACPASPGERVGRVPRLTRGATDSLGFQPRGPDVTSISVPNSSMTPATWALPVASTYISRLTAVGQGAAGGVEVAAAPATRRPKGLCQERGERVLRRCWLRATASTRRD